MVESGALTQKSPNRVGDLDTSKKSRNQELFDDDIAVMESRALTQEGPNWRRGPGHTQREPKPEVTRAGRVWRGGPGLPHFGGTKVRGKGSVAGAAAPT